MVGGVAVNVEPGIIFNHDLVGIWNRMNRFIRELQQATSANSSQMNTFDQVRLDSYLKGILAYVAWVASQPQLDLPKTSPRSYLLEAPVNPAPVENEEVNDLFHMFETARDELISSESARLPSGFVVFDQTRFVAVINKAQAFLGNYIATFTPMDMPEAGGMKPISEFVTGTGQQPVQRPTG
jgi:hypothetical protein